MKTMRTAGPASAPSALTFFLLLLASASLFAAAPACARVEKLHINKDERMVFLVESFGYEVGGHFNLTVSDFNLMVPKSESKAPPGKVFEIAFVLQAPHEPYRPEEIHTVNCFHTNGVTEDDEVFMLDQMAKWEREEFTKTITKAGAYHLFFSNCEPNSQALFHMQLEQYNVNADGTKSYLAAGESSLPTWYFLICFLFLGETVVWLSLMRKGRQSVRDIHWLMAAVIVLKTCTLFFESFEYRSINNTGEANGWNVIYYIFSSVKGVLLFTVIVLIGTGWSYMKPFLTERDKHIMLAVMVVQAMVNIAIVVLQETSPGAPEWITWQDVFHLLDMVCCCAILLPIVWSIRHLREAAEVDGKAALYVTRLKRFRKFYLLVVSYIYFTRIIVFLLNATLPFELTWMGNVLSEIAALLFFATTGYLFRPHEDNPYLNVEDAEDQADKVGSARIERGGV